MRAEPLNEINVKSDNDNLIWLVDTESKKAGKTVKLTVGAGCMAIALVNDSFSRTYFSGTYELPWKNEEKKGNVIKVVGVNLQKQFKLKFGVGGVPFNDKPAKLTPLVGIHGECDCTVSDGRAIYEAFGAKAFTVSANDIADKMRLKFAEKLHSEFAIILEEYDYFSVHQSIGKLSDKVKELYADELAKSGILLKSCSIGAPYFPEDYNEQRRQELAKIESEKSGELQRIQDVNLIRDLTKNAEAKPKQSGKKCPRCGNENNDGAVFCRNCGKKL